MVRSLRRARPEAGSKLTEEERRETDVPLLWRLEGNSADVRRTAAAHASTREASVHDCSHEAKDAAQEDYGRFDPREDVAKGESVDA